MPITPTIDSEIHDLSARINGVIDTHHILNPEGEDAERQVDEEDTLEAIIERHIHVDHADEDAILKDVEPPPIILPAISEAVEAIQLVCRYIEHDQKTQHQDLRFLQRFERHLSQTLVEQMRQSTIAGWLT
ncbi:uncharacterized protein PV09_09704 [Verruconis gallopava]|uniref:Uncharacterized protein n=1 Tax=Verruconis gallopava TaxID=253628 RepID=A0A0D1ZVK4_9PEZI|nr:uncharacterized protein PV09_09704 [Verruconis gallopava]KIV98487.1 hypothetical protein PV09_09704 [Verruconis gallopava]